jgi:hypothetical protein
MLYNYILAAFMIYLKLYSLGNGLKNSNLYLLASHVRRRFTEMARCDSYNGE